jgi:hypothetical protein
VTVTYYSVANARFFPGAVAMLNSLRLTGNEGELVFLDDGLSEDQRRRLEPYARLQAMSRDAVARPTLLKPSVHELHAGGVAVLIDSDIVVTSALDDIVDRAAEGKVCAYPDHPDALTRIFEEWVEVFGLQAPLHQRTYVNAGFLAVGGDLAPRLLRRWWETTERLLEEPWTPDARSPTWDLDQDSLNALLMSEVAPDEVVDLQGMALPPELYRTRVADERTLASTLDGRPVRLLHYTGTPKPWDARGWTRSRRDAYTELLPRLLFADDVPIRLRLDEVPVWLRPTRAGRRALSALNLVNRGLRAVASRTPRVVEDRLRLLRSRLAGH